MNQPLNQVNETGGWGPSLEKAVCEHCDRRFLIQSGDQPVICPVCYSQPLTRLPEQSTLPQPELFLPFSAHKMTISQSLERFASGLWFPPGDLSVDNLQSRLTFVYLPVWLVDSDVEATWQAGAGFNYQVVSHQERFDDNRGGWSERQVEETKIRWEPRVGRLKRSYQNVTAPALEQHQAIFKQIGDFSLTKSLKYNYNEAFGGFLQQRFAVGLPEREAREAWPEAAPGFQSAAAQECQAACTADHLREFQWTPTFTQQNWTLLLLPVITTYYVDDDQIAHALLIHGQTGRLSGVRKASNKRARRASLWMAGIALVIFLLSLVGSALSFIAPVIIPLAAIGWVAAIGVGLGAVIPLFVVWWVNRSPQNFTG